MGFGDKIQETIGKAKEGLGDLIDNDELRREGQKDRIEASAKQVGDEVNERFTDATGNVADKVEDFKRDVADGVAFGRPRPFAVPMRPSRPRRHRPVGTCWRSTRRPPQCPLD